MIQPGLVSITFRQLAPEQVVALVVQSDTDAIEWGGDVHVPHGDIARASEVGNMTVGSGLVVSTYGSYYRVGHPESALNGGSGSSTNKPVPFEAIVETAVALGAPKIRVWAGNQGTDKASPAYFDQVVNDTRRIAELAHSAGIQIAYEYHGNTLTDTVDAAKQLLEAVDHPAVGSLWQPRKIGTIEDDLAGLQAVKPWLADIHVFSWHPNTGDRMALGERADDWQRYLQQINQIPGDRFAMIEFVQDDEPNNFLRDANVLKQWLKK